MAGSNLTDTQLSLLMAAMEMIGGSAANDWAADQNYKDKSLGEILRMIYPDPAAIESESDRALYEALLNDSAIKSLVLKDTHFYQNNPEYKGDHQAFTFIDESGKPLIVYRGTQPGMTDIGQDMAIMGGNEAETDAQKDALDYARWVQATYGGDITTIGYSLGGNLAAYVAIMLDGISRCVIFNAIGFQDAFFQEPGNAERIALNRYKITAYGASGDLVHQDGIQIVDVIEVQNSGYGDIGFLGIILGPHGINGIVPFSYDAQGNLVIADTQNGLAGRRQTSAIPSTNKNRDFTTATQEKLKKTVAEIGPEDPVHFWNWDGWLRAENALGAIGVPGFKSLSPDSYQGNMDEYYKKLLDIHNASSDDIDRIFTNARQRDSALASNLKGIASTMESCATKMRAFLA